MYMTQTTTEAIRKTMPILNVVDLIGIPYKEHGRNINEGFDCYGLAIEIEKRLGKELLDLNYTYNDPKLSAEYAPTLNVRKTNEIKIGNLIEMTLNSELHIGIVISDSTYIHATRNQGVRISRIGALPYNALYEVL